jgi:hypothetical protein
MSEEAAQVNPAPEQEGSTSREARLTATFVEVADNLVQDYDVADMLHTLVVRCVEIFDITDAGIMLEDQDGNLRAVASSSEGARSMEVLQLQSESGPCWEAAKTGVPVNVPDLEAEAERWPEYVARGLELGLRSVHALPRAVEEAEESADHLQIALESRVVIEQAKGIVSNNLDLDMSRSFQLLRTYARDNNLKLTEVCKQVIDGALSPSEVASVQGGTDADEEFGEKDRA